MPFFKGSKVKRGQEDFDQGMALYESQRYDEAVESFKRSSKSFSGADQKKLSKRADAFQHCSQGYIHMLDINFLEAIKSFGKANVTFSTEGFSEEAKQARTIQAQTQGELAKVKAKEGEFLTMQDKSKAHLIVVQNQLEELDVFLEAVRAKIQTFK